MNVGILITGQLRLTREERELSIKCLQDALPDATFCYGTWDTEIAGNEDFIDNLPNQKNFRTFFEPELHYHPYIDNANANMDWQYQKKLKNPNPRHIHQTKQILMHNWLMHEFGNQFDVILRTRWDSTCSPFADIDNLIKECYNVPATISCVKRSSFDREFYDAYARFDWNDPYCFYETGDGNVFRADFSPYKMLLDAGIILHRSSDWNCDLIDRLHADKKLLAAEFGWYQALIENTEHKQWIHYDGIATLTRCLQNEEKQKLREFIQ